MIYDGAIAEEYDLMHELAGKDYEREALALISLINSLRPSTDSVLDAACGTGRHTFHLRQEYAIVEGFDLSAKMLRLAQIRNPGIKFFQADMRELEVTRKYDAIVCMFSSIGYLTSAAELETVIARFASHLSPGGVLIIEPWWFPDAGEMGAITLRTVDAQHRAICRMATARRESEKYYTQVHYLIGSPEAGVKHYAEEHSISVFREDEYKSAFEHSGLSFEFLRHRPFERGLLIGQASVRSG